MSCPPAGQAWAGKALDLAQGSWARTVSKARTQNGLVPRVTDICFLAPFLITSNSTTSPTLLC